MNYPDTYYSRQLADRKERPALSGNIDCDTVVIGAAWLASPPLSNWRVAGRRSWCSSHSLSASAHPAATAVFVSAGYATGVEQIARIIGTEAADKLYLMSIEGVDFVRDTITVSTLLVPIRWMG